MPHYNFRQDLPVAKKTEHEVAEYLRESHNIEILAFEDTYKYDILTMLRGVETKFEVKEDFLCEFTGNVGLEYECRGKLSGISTTEADFYIYKLHRPNNEFLYVLHTTDALKQMVSDKRYFRIVNGGDKGSNSMNYLFKLNVFLKTGKILPH